MPGPNRPPLGPRPFFDTVMFDETSAIRPPAWTSLQPSLQMRVVEHRCQPTDRTRRIMVDLRRTLEGGYNVYRGDPDMCGIPRSLVNAAAQQLDELSNQRIRVQVPEAFHPEPPAPPPAPPVTGISPEHLELLRKVVAAGVEWDMMSAEEGGALLESVAAVKPSAGARPEPGTGSPTGRIQGSFNPEDYLRSAMTSASTSTIRNTTATEMLLQMERAARQGVDIPVTSVNLSNVQNFSFADIERMHDELTVNIPAQAMQRAVDEELLRQIMSGPPPITPDPLRSEDDERPHAPSYPRPRSRFYRPGGR
jgi:hypothetical protein